MQTELHVRKRILGLLLLFAVLFLLLFLRIAYLTTIQSAALTQRGIRQWTREGTVYARRGRILDRNGDTLVMSATAFIVNADPRKIEDQEAFAKLVAPVLSISAETVLNNDGTTSFIPNETIFLWAFIAGLFTWLVLIPLFQKKED